MNFDPQTKTVRTDGYANLLLGYGSANRPSFAFRNGRYSPYHLAESYVTNGLSQKIIDRPSDDSIQRGVTIDGDDDSLMGDEYDRLQVMASFANAIRWSRLFGGAVIVMIAKDGGDFNEPMDLANIDTILELRVYDATSIKGTDRFYTDATDPITFGKMEYFSISPPGGNAFEIHESRLLLVGGEPYPNRYSHNNLPWIGRSVLNHVCPTLNDIRKDSNGR